jgi:predicted Zn-dependent protease
LQNAFALPGGRIHVLSGLLKISEKPDEVASMLSHDRRQRFSNSGE